MNGHRMNAKKSKLESSSLEKNQLENLRMILQKFTTKRGQIMVKESK